MNLLNEKLKIDDLILPKSISAVETGSEYVDMAEFRSALLVILGTLGEGETLSIQAFEATDASGTGAQALGAAITMDDTSNSICFIEVKANAMTDGYEFLGIKVTPSGTSEVSVAVLRGQERYAAVTQNVDSSLVID